MSIRSNKYIFAYIGNAGADDDNSAARRPADKLFNEIFRQDG